MHNFLKNSGFYNRCFFLFLNWNIKQDIDIKGILYIYHKNDHIKISEGEIYMSYHVPPDMSEKEKIVGGIFTAVQLIWLIIGLGLAALISFTFFGLIGNAAIVIGILIGIPFGFIFALKKMHGLTMIDYLKLKRVHRQITKKLPNSRKSAQNFDINYNKVEKVL